MLRDLSILKTAKKQQSNAKTSFKFSSYQLGIKCTIFKRNFRCLVEARV